MPRSILDMVADCLEREGYDGLFNEFAECGCKFGDLSPGGCLTDDCEAGELSNCNEDCGCGSWHIVAGAPKKTTDEGESEVK